MVTASPFDGRFVRTGGDSACCLVQSYAVNNDIPWIKFGKDDDKLATMSPRLRRQSATGYSHAA